MPTSYRIDQGRRLVLTQGWGEVDEDELVSHYLAMAGDPDFDPAFDQLGDLREVTRLNASAHRIRDAARLVVFSESARRAFVATADHIYGVARMYEMVAACDAHQNVGVFRTMAEAEDWLGT